MLEKVFKVVKIVNEYNVVINAGARDITKDDVLEVFAPGDVVIDPDTNEELGALNYIKARLVPIDIFEKMTLCENQKQYHSMISTVASLQNALIGNIKEGPIRLNVDPNEISGVNEDSSNKNIKIGDKVRIQRK